MLIDTFDGANNQLITARPGWVILGSGVCNAMCDGAGAMKASGAGDSAVVAHNTGSPAHYVQAVVGAGFSDITANRIFNIVLRCTNRGDYVGIRHDATDNRWEAWWNGSNRMGAYVGDCLPGDVVYAEVSHAHDLVVRVNGSVVIPVTNLGPDKTSGHAGTLAGNTVRADVFRSIEIGTIMGPPTGGIDSTYGGTGQRVVITGTQANATNASVMLLPHASDPQGAVVQGPKAATITGGTWACEFIAPGGRYTSSATLSNSNFSATFTGPEVTILTIGGQPIADGEEPPADTENPVMTGALSRSNLTSTSYDITGYGATDNVGVAGFERSLDEGSTWLSVGSATSFSATGRTPGATDQVRVRAFDFAGNRAEIPLSLAVTLQDAVPAAPVITAQAANATVAEGGTASFTAAASGTGPLTWAWLTRPAGDSGAGTVVSGATAATLNTAELTLSENGRQYRPRVTNANPTPTLGDWATVTVNAAAVPAPTITTQPAAATVTEGAPASFAVAATGSGTLSYQWFMRPAGDSGSGSNASGSSTAVTYSTGNLALSANGQQYRARVRNTVGGNSTDTFSNWVAVTVNAVVVEPPVQTEAYRVRMPAVTYFDYFAG